MDVPHAADRTKVVRAKAQDDFKPPTGLVNVSAQESDLRDLAAQFEVVLGRLLDLRLLAARLGDEYRLQLLDIARGAGLGQRGLRTLVALVRLGLHAGQ